MNNQIDRNSTVAEVTEALRIEREQKYVECNADLGHPCDAGNNGDPCHECAANEAYWRNQWERHGKHERTREEFESDVRDAYSHPTERSKRDSLLGAQ